MVSFNEFLTTTYFSNTGLEYAHALGVAIALIIFLAIFKQIVLTRLHAFSRLTKNHLDDLLIDIVKNIHWPFYVFLALYVASRSLVLPEIVLNVIEIIVLMSIVFYVVKGVISFQNYIVARIIARENDTKHNEGIIYAMSGALKGVWWAIGILTVLSNLGFNITTLIAGLGIGGLAIAFAFQKLLEDVFSSVSIYFDKPFEIGDFIIVGEHLGVVKRVGIKSTRIQALQGEEIVISNRELTSTRIQNYKRMEKRRIAFTFGVVYGTSNKKLEKIPEIIKDIMSKIDVATLDRAHFKAFGSFSLDFEVVYYLASSSYNVYMDTQQKINLELKAALEKEKIEFARSTQIVLFQK